MISFTTKRVVDTLYEFSGPIQKHSAKTSCFPHQHVVHKGVRHLVLGIPEVVPTRTYIGLLYINRQEPLQFPSTIRAQTMIAMKSDLGNVLVVGYYVMGSIRVRLKNIYCVQHLILSYR